MYYCILLYEKTAHSFEPVHDDIYCHRATLSVCQCFLTNPSVHGFQQGGSNLVVRAQSEGGVGVGPGVD